MGKKSYTRWLFVLPAIVIVIALFIYPICSSIVYSFTNKNLIKPAYKFIGFKNYAEVLRDSGFWLSFFNSLKWTVLSLVGQIAVGFTAALALKRIKVCKGVYKTLLIIPWAFPSMRSIRISSSETFSSSSSGLIPISFRIRFVDTVKRNTSGANALDTP